MFKKILDKLSNYLKNKSKTDSKTNSILLQIDHDNKVNLKVFINNNTIESADRFGLLLFLLNEGYYVQGFLDILSDLSKQNPYNDKFVKQTISSWSNKITESAELESNINSNDPVIKPTEFNVGKN